MDRDRRGLILLRAFGAGGLLISPFVPAYGPNRLRSMSGETPEERRTKLTRAEELLRACAEREKAGRGGRDSGPLSRASSGHVPHAAIGLAHRDSANPRHLWSGGGIAGAVVVSLLSDSLRRRRPFILLALAGVIPGLVGMTYGTSSWLLLLSGFVFGFFLLSAGPVGFQYAAEITHPAPEGTSNTLLLVMGQVSGILFIVGMDALRMRPSGAMTTSLLILIALSALNFMLATALPESPIRSRPGPHTRKADG